MQTKKHLHRFFWLFTPTIDKEPEKSHPRYAIALRNEWMIKKAEYAITYIKYPIGGAYKYAEAMKRKGKTVINLADV
ncbi:MAG: hypothetical protein IJN97_04510 [Oscillospiraceae bacterium]|nr:hypothetical protein [Oscillospiraceae bacterium]